MYKCVQNKVSVTTHVGKYPIKENYQNGCYLATTGQKDKYEGHRCISVLNMKFLCLTLFLGEVCTDVNADTKTPNEQSMIVQGSLVDKPNVPKTPQSYIKCTFLFLF